MGVPVGDYGFRWYLHGPYSQSLQDDMHYEDGRSYIKPTLSKEYADSIQQLHQLIRCLTYGEHDGKRILCITPKGIAAADQYLINKFFSYSQYAFALR